MKGCLCLAPKMAVLIWLFHFIPPARALMPPHPDWVKFEPVHQMRKRLNITYSYNPLHLPAEHCRYLDEHACELEDEGMGHAKAGRHGRQLSPSVGNDFRILVVLLRFSDHKSRELPTREYFEELFNGPERGEQSITNPVGSVKEYFRYSSLGNYRVQFDVRDWHDAPNTEAFYSQGQSGLVGQVELQKMFYTAMDEIDNSDIDWFDGYINDWGLLNHVVVIHSGYGAEYGPVACAADPNNRIWSQGSASSQTGWLSRDFFQVNGYAVASAHGQPTCSDGEATFNPNGIGVILHEYLHGFSLLDLYDQDDSESQIAIGGTGRFDIMSNAHGWDRNPLIPGHMSPFSRLSVPGWLEPIVIQEDGYYAVQPSEISSHVYKIEHGFPEGEYLLIENRQPIKWDENWPSTCGILIYHVDETVFKQTTRGYPGKEGWPKDHYMVSIIQADGLYEIEKNINVGDEGDFWKKDQVLGPGPSFPNTDSIQNGVQQSTGITIRITSSPGFIMTFQVEGIGNAQRSNRDDKRDSGLPDPNTTGEATVWILSVLGGIAAMIGLLFVVF